MRLRIADGVSDSGSGNSTTGALGDEPPSRSAIGGTSRECSVALSPSAMKWKLLARRHLPQLPLSASSAHDFELASFCIGSGPVCVVSGPVAFRQHLFEK